MNPAIADGSASKATVADRLPMCDQEPIHIPGAIQPHGLLIGLDESNLQLLQCSANLAQACGRDIDALLGATLDQLIDGRGLERLRHQLATSSLERPTGAGVLQLGGRAYDAVVHRHDGLLNLELEPCDSSGENSFSSIYPRLRSFVASLQQVKSLEQLCELAASEMHSLTGFGRVLVYRFDEQGHGQVLAERLDDGYDSYQGLHFPASDIPAQARALYLANHIRLIADAHYRAVPLVPALNPRTGGPTDLSYCGLRSVSPVHLQYMRNMGTIASMSVSIVVRGRLWGLISCHHASARTLPFEVRSTCEHLGHVLSLQIEAWQEREESAHRLELHRVLVKLLASMADRGNLVEGLIADADDLLHFASASGAAIVSGGRCLCVGQSPPEPAVLALADWLARQPDQGCVSSHELAADYAPAAVFEPAIAGLLAISISQIHAHYVMWFRPEVVQTVRWAGDPRKGVSQASDGSLALHPRDSFGAWSETVRGTSQRWRSSEIAAAEDLRRAILGVVLRRAEELAALNDELERSNKELEAFSYSVSHDLRAPLRHITGYTDLLLETENAQLSERGRRFLHNIDESAHFAGTLVDDLLSFSQMGRAAIRLGSVDLDELVRRVIRDLRDETAGRDIVWQIDMLPAIVADSAFIQLAIRNLLANAVKYSRGRQPAVIQIKAEEMADAWVVHVRDNGAGFNMKYVGKLFGVFQRLHRMEDFEGTGIGLANVRRIVERHGGRVWAQGELGVGAQFSFSLPKPMSSS